MPQPRNPQGPSDDKLRQQLLDRYAEAFLMANWALADPDRAARTLSRLVLRFRRALAELEAQGLDTQIYDLTADECDDLSGLIACSEHMAEIDGTDAQIRLAASQRGLRILRSQAIWPPQNN